jgi:hypothetical protein
VQRTQPCLDMLPYPPPDDMDMLHDCLIPVPEEVVIGLDTLFTTAQSFPSHNALDDIADTGTAPISSVYPQNKFTFTTTCSGKHGVRLSNLSRWLKRELLEISQITAVSANPTESDLSGKATIRPSPLKKAAKRYLLYRRKIKNMVIDQLWWHDRRKAEKEQVRDAIRASARRGVTENTWTFLRWMKAVTFELTSTVG